MQHRLLAPLFLLATCQLSGCGGYAPTSLPGHARTTDANVYWAGEPPPNPPGAPGCDLARLAAPYKHPRTMAIGGSVYNGTTSLKTNWFQSEWSAPALVAMSLGEIEVVDGRRTGRRTFWVPQYPDHGHFPAVAESRTRYADGSRVFETGLDIERASLARIVSTARTQAGNISILRFGEPPPNGRLFNDNLGIAGSDSYDVINRSPAKIAGFFAARMPAEWGASGSYAEAVSKALHTSSPFSVLGDIKPLTAAIQWANAAFVLNPQRHPCLDGLSPLDHVRLRKPHRVLINVGSNDGIYKFMLEGTPVSKPYQQVLPEDPSTLESTSINEAFGHRYIENMKALLDGLKNEPVIKYVYINSNLRPTAAANLTPLNPCHGGQEPGRLYDSYVTEFNISGRRKIAGQMAREANDLTTRVNNALKAHADMLNRMIGPRPGLGRKFVVVDLAALSDQLDYAHFCGRNGQGEPIVVRATPNSRPVRLTNLPLAFSTEPQRDSDMRIVAPGIRQGGIFGVDNLHPTLVGYAALARYVVSAIRANESLPDDPRLDAFTSPQALYANPDLVAGHLLRNADSGEQARTDEFQSIFDVGRLFSGK